MKIVEPPVSLRLVKKEELKMEAAHLRGTTTAYVSLCNFTYKR